MASFSTVYLLSHHAVSYYLALIEQKTQFYCVYKSMVEIEDKLVCSRACDGERWCKGDFTLIIITSLLSCDDVEPIVSSCDDKERKYNTI